MPKKYAEKMRKIDMWFPQNLWEECVKTAGQMTVASGKPWTASDVIRMAVEKLLTEPKK